MSLDQRCQWFGQEIQLEAAGIELLGPLAKEVPHELGLENLRTHSVCLVKSDLFLISIELDLELTQELGPYVRHLLELLRVIRHLLSS